MSLVSSLPIRFVVCFAACCATLTTVVAEGAGTKNVLLLCIDDLRPVLGCYGGQAKTPHLDHLAKSATVFTRHYVQWPVCGPSRASMLGGLRPDTTGIYELGDSWKISKRPETHPTLPRYFRDHGYRTLSFGKVYHGRGNGDGYGWSEDPWKLDWSCYVDFPYESKKKGQWRPAIEIHDGPETKHNDYQTADHVIRAVKANKDRSFFIAGGFYKPHLPFVVPRRYWDEYSAEQVQLLTPRRRAQGAAEFMYNWTEVASYGLRKGALFSDDSNVDEQAAHRMTRAYYACVSFIDAQIGRILETLDENGLSDTTAVVIWSDHGFHLGDHGRWAKHTQFEQAMRSPLIVRIPGHQTLTGTTEAIVESVDIYPTLCEFAGLTSPEFLQGESLIPVLQGRSAGKAAAFSQIRPVKRNEHDVMAYSVRSEHFRFVQWKDASSDEVVMQELYDHRSDPEESVNVAHQPRYQESLRHHAWLVSDRFGE